MKQPEVEVLPPLSEAETAEIAPLKIQTPIEDVQRLFETIAQAQEKAVVWADKTNIVDSATRDEAIGLGKLIKRTANLIDERRLALQAPVKDYITELKTLCDKVRKPLLDAEATLNKKIVDYAAAETRKAEEEKRIALAKLREEEEKREAEKREREAAELLKRQEEDRRLEEVRLKALEEAKASAPVQGELTEGEVPNTDVEDATLAAMSLEQAKIDQERAERDRLSSEQAALDEADRLAREQAAKNDMAKAQHKTKTKGVKTVWCFELLDISQVPRQYLSYDETKVRKYLQSGVADDQTNPEKVIPGLRCWKAIQAHKGGN